MELSELHHRARGCSYQSPGWQKGDQSGGQYEKSQRKCYGSVGWHSGNIMPEIIARYPTVTPLYEGQNREAGKLTKSVKIVLPAILFGIFAIIAFTFRSYSQPLMLFIMVPFSLIGVALGHWIHGFPINMLSWLGIIALIGIMVNDGLVISWDFLNRYLPRKMRLIPL